MQAPHHVHQWPGARFQNCLCLSDRIRGRAPTKREVGILASDWGRLLCPIDTLRQEQPEPSAGQLTAGQGGCQFLMDQGSQKDSVISALRG